MSRRSSYRRPTAASHVRHAILFIIVVAIGVFLAPGVITTVLMCTATAIIAFFIGWFCGRPAVRSRAIRSAGKLRAASRSADTVPYRADLDNWGDRPTSGYPVLREHPTEGADIRKMLRDDPRSGVRPTRQYGDR